jgi:MFS family permease
MSDKGYTAISGSAERPANFFNELLGTEVLVNLHRDAVILIACKSLRLFSFGMLSVILVVYLTEVGFPIADVGWMFTLTLLGDALISIILTSRADYYGRRLTLIVGSVLSGLTSVIFLTQTNFYVLLIASILGVISPSGNELGPFMSIELSGLAEVTPSKDRTRLLAWYNLFGCFCSAGGALLCGFTVDRYLSLGYAPLESYKVVLFMYAILQFLLGCLFCLLSPQIEVPPKADSIKEVNPVSLFMGLHKSKAIIFKLSCFFMIDSFAGTFVLMSIITDWFHIKYGTSPKDLGKIVFFCNLVAGVSALFAAKLADHIGLIMTMVVTHLPSNILLTLVPLMPDETLAIGMLCARYCISQMDVPTRNAYVQSVVESDERSAANGITNVVRSIGGAAGPYLSGLLITNPNYMGYPFFIAGGLKIVYDLLLVGSFASVKTPDETARLLPR